MAPPRPAGGGTFGVVNHGVDLGDDRDFAEKARIKIRRAEDKPTRQAVEFDQRRSCPQLIARDQQDRSIRKPVASAAKAGGAREIGEAQRTLSHRDVAARTFASPRQVDQRRRFRRRRFHRI